MTQRPHTRYRTCSCELQSHTCSYLSSRESRESLHQSWSNPLHRDEGEQSFRNPSERLAVSYDLTGGSRSRSLSPLSLLSHILGRLSSKKCIIFQIIRYILLLPLHPSPSAIHALQSWHHRTW